MFELNVERTKSIPYSYIFPTNPLGPNFLRTAASLQVTVSEIKINIQKVIFRLNYPQMT